MTEVRDEMTERLLDDAGIAAGMRVLDVGCGRGDVSRMIAQRVGEQGQVLGIDREARPLATAREREGADIYIGFRFPSVLTQAGLAVEQVRAEAVVQMPGHTIPPKSLSAPCSPGSCSTASPPRKK